MARKHFSYMADQSIRHASMQFSGKLLTNMPIWQRMNQSSRYTMTDTSDADFA